MKFGVSTPVFFQCVFLSLSLSLWCIMGLWNFLGRLILMTRTDLHSSASLFQTLVCCLHGQLPSKGASWHKTDLELVCVTFHPKKEIRTCFKRRQSLDRQRCRFWSRSYGSEQCFLSHRSWSCRCVDYVSSCLIRDELQFVRSPSFLQRRKQRASERVKALCFRREFYCPCQTQQKREGLG